MKSHTLFTITICVAYAIFTTCLAEDIQPQITSPLSDGVPAPIVKQPEPPEFSVLWEREIKQGGRKVKVRKALAPELQDVEPTRRKTSNFSPKQTASFINQASQDIPQHVVIVSATVYDGQFTRMTAWSNVNWNHLSGFTSFEGRNQAFSIMIMTLGDVSRKELRKAQKSNPSIVIPQVPKELPSLSKSEPLYVITDDGNNNETCLEFLEAIHDLYVTENKRLREAYRSRESYKREKQRELLKNPPKPQDLELTFWNNN